LINSKGVRSENTAYLPNGADLDLFSPCPKDETLLTNLKIGTGAKIFLYAGTHGYAQRLDTVIEAAALVSRPDIHFLFIGDGPEKPRLEKVVHQRHLSNVTFLPARPAPEVRRYFSLATASIVPLMKADLFLDALPSKLIASLACGVPPIFAGDGEAAQLLRENECGIVVAPESPNALLTAVQKLSDDLMLRSNLSANARRLAENNFAWDKITEKWLNTLQQKCGFK
jgi:colanic acid biosynthesis glycosyl transferase WcaI